MVFNLRISSSSLVEEIFNALIALNFRIYTDYCTIYYSYRSHDCFNTRVLYYFVVFLAIIYSIYRSNLLAATALENRIWNSVNR